MYNTQGLIPTKFLTLIAHLTISLLILWSSEVSVMSCLPENHSPQAFSSQHTQLIVSLSISLGLISFELLMFLLGLTMFHSTSALVSIGCHGIACLVLCYLIIDGWQCGWHWFIFASCSVTPVLYDLSIVTDIVAPRNNWTTILIVAGISTTFGSSLSAGYNIGVVNSPAEIIKEFCNASIWERYDTILGESQLGLLWSSIVSIFLVGGAIGSLSGSWLADKSGRKGALIVSIVLAFCGGLLFLVSKSANSIEMLLIGRLLVGLSAGLTTTVVPMYLMELAPLKLRGSMGVLCPLGVTFGVFVGQFMSLSQVLGTKESWHILLAFFVLILVISSTALPFLPESPKYLFVIRKETQLALQQLVKIRNAKEEYLEVDILELQNEKRDDTEDIGNWNLKTVITNKSLLLPILLVCSMQAGQQFVGINAVFYYSVSIFMKAGLTEQNSQYATMGAGLINLGMAVISIYIMANFDRRIVYQISSASAAVCLFTLGIATTYITSFTWMPYLSILGVLGFVLCYGIGLGPIPYFIGSELFEVGPRPSAMALGSMANWGGNFIIGMTFPAMQATIGAASFFIFSIVAVLLFFFIRMYLPETRGCDPTTIARQCNNGLKITANSPVSSADTEEINDV